MHTATMPVGHSEIPKRHAIFTGEGNWFLLTKKQKRALDNAIDETQATSSSSSQSKAASTVQPPNEKELQSFFATRSQCGTKPVILSLIPEYASSYVPKCRQSNFPIPLQSLSDTAHRKLSFTDLLGTCNNVNLDINEEMVTSVEEATREQSTSNLWYTHRAGRVYCFSYVEHLPDRPFEACSKLIECHLLSWSLQI